MQHGRLNAPAPIAGERDSGRISMYCHSASFEDRRQHNSFGGNALRAIGHNARIAGPTQLFRDSRSRIVERRACWAVEAIMRHDHSPSDALKCCATAGAKIAGPTQRASNRKSFVDKMYGINVRDNGINARDNSSTHCRLSSQLCRTDHDHLLDLDVLHRVRNPADAEP